MALHLGLIGWCNRVKRLEDFFEHLGRALDLWNPTIGECVPFLSDAYPAPMLKLEDSIWQGYPGSWSLSPGSRTGTIKNRDFVIHQSGSRSISLKSTKETSMGRVQDKVVVVTGAANGLGEAIALRLAHDGAKMVLADIDGPGLATTATAIRDDGGEAVTVVGDVTEEKPAAELIEAAIEHFGQIDG